MGSDWCWLDKTSYMLVSWVLAECGLGRPLKVISFLLDLA